MKHTRQVVPSDSDLIPQENLPNRSDLSKLYISSRQANKERNTVDKLSRSDSEQQEGAFVINKVFVSLLLTALISIVYLLVLYIYQSAEANLKHPDPLYPLIRFFVTAASVLGWIILFRILSKQFSNTGARLSTFLVAYLFYLFPALKIVYASSLHVITGPVFTVMLWLIFNFLVVFNIIWAFNRQSSGLNKVAVVAIPIFILIVCAVLF